MPRRPPRAVGEMVISLAPPASTPDGDLMPWSALRDTGLLWLINTAALHPRGFALAISYGDATREEIEAGAEPVGFYLVGDGSEPWQFADPPDRPGYVDGLFRKVEALFESRRGQGGRQ